MKSYDEGRLKHYTTDFIVYSICELQGDSKENKASYNFAREYGQN